MRRKSLSGARKKSAVYGTEVDKAASKWLSKALGHSRRGSLHRNKYMPEEPTVEGGSGYRYAFRGALLIHVPRCC